MGRNRKPRNPILQEDSQTFAQQPDWFPYDNTTYFNAAMLSPELQRRIRMGGFEVAEAYKYIVRSKNMQKWLEMETMFESLGLNPDNRKDCQIYADLTGVFARGNDISVARTVDPEYKNDTIHVINNSFYTADDAPSGLGYTMVARQVQAAQEVAKRTGKKVFISVAAAQGLGDNGMAVWPKLGYAFDILPNWQKILVQDYGFKSEDVENGTQNFMDKQNRDGVLGWDVWRDFVEKHVFYGQRGETTVYPDGRETPELAITRKYGKLRGYNKMMGTP